MMISLKDKKVIDNKSILLTKFMLFFESKNDHQDQSYQECLI